MDALRALLERVEAEHVMEIDAVKESSYVASDGRRRGPGAGPGLSRWAILGGDGCVIGYMSGRFGGGIQGRDLPRGNDRRIHQHDRDRQGVAKPSSRMARGSRVREARA